MQAREDGAENQQRFLPFRPTGGVSIVYRNCMYNRVVTQIQLLSSDLATKRLIELACLSKAGTKCSVS